MVSRRDMLILGSTTLVSACGGNGSNGGDGGVQSAALAGAALPEGPYGVRIAGWSGQLQAVGDVSAARTDQPSAMPSSLALRLGWSDPPSSAQQAVIPAAATYVPKGSAAGFSLALWARNPGPRTLGFRLRLFDGTRSRQMVWNCAADPLDRWIVLTVSPSQLAMANWDFGHDAVAFVLVEQQDDTPEGPWTPGDLLLFGDLYADVPGRSVFLITFDDGFASQRHPAPAQRASPYNVVIGTGDNVLYTVGEHTVVIGDPIVFPANAPPGLKPATTYWVMAVPALNAFRLALDATLTAGAATTGFQGTAPFAFADLPARSGQQIVESYGFKGSLFLVPAWLGTSGVHGYTRRPNTFMSAADALAMAEQGWSIGSHTFSHPSSAENAGLRLLGPYGYFLSNPVDAMPRRYVHAWGLDPSFRRRAVRAQAGLDLITFENPHRFLVNMPIAFTGGAPPGFAPGRIYYCQSVRSPVSATFASDQGSLRETVAVAADWAGLADYRYPGAALDDSAIYDDIMAGIAGLETLGITTARKFFALPQGAADIYVRSACMRAGLGWVRGASDHAHTFTVGMPTGGGLSNIENTPGGWLAQPDCIQTDSFLQPSIRDIGRYIDDGIAQQACGCSYHHAVDGATVANLDNMCAALRRRADAGLVEVLTLDEMAALLRR